MNIIVLRARWALPTAFLSCLLMGSAAAEPKVAVIELRASGLDDNVASNLSELMVSEIAKIPGHKVIARSEVQDLVGFGIDQQSLGCDDPKCLAEMGNALGADLLVTGSVGAVGATYVVSVKLIDIHQQETRSRVADTIAGRIELLTHFVRIAAWRLFEQPVPAPLQAAYDHAAKAPQHDISEEVVSARTGDNAEGPASLIEPDPAPAAGPANEWARPARNVSTALAALSLLGGGALHVVSFLKRQAVGDSAVAADGEIIYPDGTQKDARMAKSLQSGAFYAYGAGGFFVAAAVVFAILEPAQPAKSALQIRPTANGLAVRF